MSVTITYSVHHLAEQWAAHHGMSVANWIELAIWEKAQRG
jgi:predicted HicB family RNase H-like nuclease